MGIYCGNKTSFLRIWTDAQIYHNMKQIKPTFFTNRSRGGLRYRSPCRAAMCTVNPEVRGSPAYRATCKIKRALPCFNQNRSDSSFSPYILILFIVINWMKCITIDTLWLELNSYVCYVNVFSPIGSVVSQLKSTGGLILKGTKHT